MINIIGNVIGNSNQSSGEEDIAIEPIDITGRSNIEALGDSITLGSNASPSSNSYINRFNTAEAGITTVRNSAVSGRGVYQAAVAIQPLSFTRSQTIISVMAGLNDIRRNGAAAKTIKKIEACYRTILLKGLSAGNVPSGHSTVTRTGTWNAFAANTVGGTYPSGTLPGNFAVNSPNAIGSKLSWQFTGTAFGIQFIGCDGVITTHGTGTIKVDGVLVYTVDLNNWYDGVSDGSNANNRGPVAFTFHGFDSATHTVEVETTSNGNFPVDFFALINTPENSTAFMFFEIPYLNEAGYAVSPNLGSVSASDQASVIIKSIVTEYRTIGYTFVYVPTNEYYDLLTGLDTDNIHPNNTGHLQIFNAMSAAVI